MIIVTYTFWGIFWSFFLFQICLTAFTLKLKTTEILLKVKSITTQGLSIAEKIHVTITFFKILSKNFIYQLSFKI